MIITDNERFLIEKHLDKRLNEVEKIEFEQQLKDPTFATEVELYERAVITIRANADARLKAILQEEEAKKSTTKVIEMTPQYETLKHVPKTRQWAFAAGFLLLVGAGLVFWLNKGENQNNTEGVLASNFKPYRNYEKPTVRDEVTKNDLEKAYALYDNEQFAESLSYFERLTPPQYEATFFQANAYLANNQADKAIPILEKLSQDQSFKWQQAAEWFLALALSEKQVVRANTLFEKIKNTAGHPYQEQAKKVLMTKK